MYREYTEKILTKGEEFLKMLEQNTWGCHGFDRIMFDSNCSRVIHLRIEIKFNWQ